MKFLYRAWAGEGERERTGGKKKLSCGKLLWNDDRT